MFRCEENRVPGEKEVLHLYRSIGTPPILHKDKMICCTRLYRRYHR